QPALCPTTTTLTRSIWCLMTLPHLATSGLSTSGLRLARNRPMSQPSSGGWSKNNSNVPCAWLRLTLRKAGHATRAARSQKNYSTSIGQAQSWVQARVNLLSVSSVKVRELLFSEPCLATFPAAVSERRYGYAA